MKRRVHMSYSDVVKRIYDLGILRVIASEDADKAVPLT